MNVFSIGDIHGCVKQLVALQDKIFDYPTFNKDKDLLLYLGDYIDRGPSPKGVIDLILQLQAKGIKSVFLKGNHEQFMIDYLFNKINNLNSWIMNGADQTFKSYDIEVAEFIKDGFEDQNVDKLRNIFLNRLTKEHIYFFNNLKLTYAMGDYLFVHAGINPEKLFSEQSEIDFLWSRSNQFFNKDFEYEKIIVHGHTPEKDVINFPYRINVDTGCFFSRKLSCVCLNDENKERKFIYS